MALSSFSLSASSSFLSNPHKRVSPALKLPSLLRKYPIIPKFVCPNSLNRCCLDQNFPPENSFRLEVTRGDPSLAKRGQPPPISKAPTLDSSNSKLDSGLVERARRALFTLASSALLFSLAFNCNAQTSLASSSEASTPTIGYYCQLAGYPPSPTDVVKKQQELKDRNPFNGQAEGASSDAMALAMNGMSMPNFNPMEYVGRWYEVTSIKRGFSGQGQEDCHCTQGVYSLDFVNKQIEADTFCVHGSPTGFITGIRGTVKCISDNADFSRLETKIEKEEMIQQKCYLRFPSIPFFPLSTYDVIETDYKTYALVSGSQDKSFVQVYSRTPNPGEAFIQKQKAKLVALGFKEEQFRDTPQDCPIIEMSELEKMMSKEGMDAAMNNVLPQKLPEKLDLEKVLRKRRI